MKNVRSTFVIAVVCAMASLAPGVEPGVSPAFTPLKFGDTKPRGWILAQMKRDLTAGFAGRLDELCHEASSDIFVTGRNRPGKANAGNAAGDAWWNGETEGNWHCGHFMLSCLTEDPAAMAKAKTYLEHILASQDVDGYIGIFSPELRYRGNGELWTQNCLFRGMLAYSEATGDERVFAAVKRAVDRTIAGYAQRGINFSQHDAVYTDVLEYLWSRTGDRKYVDFGLRLYRECPNLVAFINRPESGGVFSRCFCGAHGATVTEMIRIPFWFWIATGDSGYRRLGRQAVTTVQRWSMPDGAMVSDEWVTTLPRPWNVGYEYCAMQEQECTYLSAGRKTGEAQDFDAVEHLWFNAMQGAREPDGSAILYCSDENRLSVHDEHGGRSRFTPTGQHVAVCCNPNSTRVAPYYIANAWLKPAGPEPALAAALYGPCRLTTELAGTRVQVEEATAYPYSDSVELTLTPEKPAEFCLWLRNPSWSKDTKIACAGADIRRVGDFWQLRKMWKPGDTVTIKFDQAVREVPAINGEVALQYGPLLYVLPVKGERETVKSYAKSELKDYFVNLPKGTDPKEPRALFLPEAKRAVGFGFTPKIVVGTNPDYPLDNPPVVLEGALLRQDGSALPVTLVPMGAKSAELRRVTFRVGIPPPPMTGGLEAENAKMLGRAHVYNDPAASGGAIVGFIGNVGDGIECKSPLLAGQQLKIRYATPVTATMTLHVNDTTRQITFPATGLWSGEGAYEELTVPVAIPTNAVIQLQRAPGDGAVNFDCLKGIPL